MAQKKSYTSIEDYINDIPLQYREGFDSILTTIQEHIPDGFEMQLSYGMIGFVVPHSIYPKGYHCNPKLPLPFINLALTKSNYALYHMGVYADPDLLNWYVDAYTKQVGKKPNMGKSCLRFNFKEDLPLNLIGELVSKTTVEDWIERYENRFVN